MNFSIHPAAPVFKSLKNPDQILTVLAVKSVQTPRVLLPSACLMESVVLPSCLSFITPPCDQSTGLSDEGGEPLNNDRDSFYILLG